MAYFPPTVPVCMPGCEGGGICTSTNKCSCPPDKTGPRCQFDRNGKYCYLAS